jgi:predicted dinucleotide-binding enzyme
MKVGVLGTGIVGRTVGTKLARLGHQVKMGSRTTDNPAATEWAAGEDENANNGTFADAAEFGDMVINATAGGVSIQALETAGRANLDGKVLVDVANPLDFSKGMPPTLSVSNDDSLAEQIQRTFPDTRVVKALNTMTAQVMVEPSAVAGSHNVFIAGNDQEAKAAVVALLEEFGWQAEDILDLGDLTAARGLEMVLPLWVRLMMVQGSAAFNFKIVR